MSASLTSHAQSLAPQGITLQGRIIKPDSTPLEAASVTFTVEVRSPDPDDCLLYTENQTQVMTGSSGIFSFSIGSGSRSGTNFENVSTLAQVFNNSGTMLSPLVCTSGATSYSPSSTHKRKMRFSFDDGSGPQLISQAIDVQSVPYALYADTLQGKPASGYLQVNTAGGKALSQGNLESVFQSSSYVTELLALIAGTSTQYATSGGGGGNFNFGTGKFYVDGTSGNVGLGTATPFYLLDVTKSQNASTTINVANANSGMAAAANVLTTSDAGTTQMSTVSTAAGGYGRISSNSQSLALDAQNASGFLSFRTGAAPTERMRITSTGNVGIGTASPTSRITVPWISGDAAPAALFGSGDPSNNQSAISAASGGGNAISATSTNGAAIAGSSLNSTGVYGSSSTQFGVQGASSSSNSGYFQSSSASNASPTLVVQQKLTSTADLQQWQNNSGTAVVKIGSNGDMGIGTSTPTTKLHVNTSATWDGLSLTNGANTYGLLADEGSATGRFSLAANGATNVQISAGTGTATYFKGGNVGIGTTTPSAPLQVNGISQLGGTAANLTSGVPASLENTGQMLVGWNLSGGRGETNFVSNPGAGTRGGFLFSQFTNAGIESNLFAIDGNGGAGIGKNYSGLFAGPPANGLIIEGNVGIGTTAPSVSLDLGSKTDALRLPSGTTAQEPTSPTAGLIRYNTNSGTPPGWVEFYNGSAWVNLVGSSTAGNLSNVGNITGSGAVTIAPGGTTQNLNLSNTTGGAVNVTTSAGNIALQPGGTGSVTVPNSTASIGTTSGALVVGGGIGVAGSINAGGAGKFSGILSSGTIGTTGALNLYNNTGTFEGGISAYPSETQFYESVANGNFTFVTHDSGGTAGERMRITGSGNVGIGVTTPTSPLTIASTGYGATVSIYHNLSNQDGYVSFIPVGGYTNSNPRWDIGSTVDYPADFVIKASGTSASYPFAVTSTGNVGIGTTTPGTSLDVNGGIRAGASTAVTATCNSTNEGIQRYNYSTHFMEYCNGSDWTQITAQAAGTTTPVMTSGPPVGASTYAFSGATANYAPGFGSIANTYNGTWPAVGSSGASNSSCVELDTQAAANEQIVYDLGTNRSIGHVYFSANGPAYGLQFPFVAFSQDNVTYNSSIGVNLANFLSIQYGAVTLGSAVTARYIRVTNGGPAPATDTQSTFCQIAVGP